MFLLVPAHPGFPGQIPQSRKMVVCVCNGYVSSHVILYIILGCIISGPSDLFIFHLFKCSRTLSSVIEIGRKSLVRAFS